MPLCNCPWLANPAKMPSGAGGAIAPLNISVDSTGDVETLHDLPYNGASIGLVHPSTLPRANHHAKMGCLPLHRDHACPHNPSFSDRLQDLTQVHEQAIALLEPTDIPHGMGRLDS